MPGRETPVVGNDPLIDEAAAWLARLRLSSTPDDQQAFETWYAADPAHADAYDAVVGGWNASGNITRSLDGPRQSNKWSGNRHAMAAAAAILVLVLTGFGLTRLGLFESQKKPATDFASGVGEIRTFSLDDGSRVTIDTDSLVRVAYTPDERRLLLTRGRARFDVAPDARRPFVVFAGSGSITARGTLFDVAIDDTYVTVALLRGSVEVRQSTATPASTDKATKRLLMPGQGVSMSNAAPLPPSRSLRSSETRWISGMLSFENARLADAVAAANRYNVAQIILVDAASHDLRFTGTFRATDAIAFAKLLAATFDLQLSKDASGNLRLAVPVG